MKSPIKDYMSDNIGIQTPTDIIAELKKPGRDPRQIEFELPCFRNDVQLIKDIKAWNKSEGIVTSADGNWTVVISAMPSRWACPYFRNYLLLYKRSCRGTKSRK